MVIGRDYKETIKARIFRDPDFKKALATEELNDVFKKLLLIDEEGEMR